MTTVTKYGLRIFEASSKEDVLEDVISSTPFATIAVGDIINCSVFPHSNYNLIQVTGIEHKIIHEKEEYLHYIGIYTEEV